MLPLPKSNEHRFHFKCGGPEMNVLRFTGTEGLNELFAYEIDLVVHRPPSGRARPDSEIDFDAIVGKPAGLQIIGPEADRYVQGIVSRKVRAWCEPVITSGVAQLPLSALPSRCQRPRGGRRVSKFRGLDFAIFAKSLAANFPKIVALDRPRSSGLMDRNRADDCALDWSGHQVARVGAAVPFFPLLRCAVRHCLLGYLPDLIAFPFLSFQREEGRRPPRAQLTALRVGGRRRTVPTGRKRHEVGRVARRARPDIARHRATYEHCYPALP